MLFIFLPPTIISNAVRISSEKPRILHKDLVLITRHSVVHYRECKNEEDMSTAETIILNKLKDYREQANRDRFILPDDKDVSFFTTVVDQCIEFI